MRVTRNFAVTLDYRVTDTNNNVVDEGENPLTYLHGGYNSIFPKIEKALEGKGIGDSVTVKLAPKDSFGDYDPDLVLAAPRSAFPSDIKLGDMVEGDDPDDPGPYRVTEIDEEEVELDGNHPLAGIDIVFTCTVAALRPARIEEIERGSLEEEEDE
jgi:FKBP-type peptidyl-prolyl cis-trans isomerase SlyD